VAQKPRELSPTRSLLDFFGAELRLLRERAGLSMADLGARINYDSSLVGRVERAQQVPSQSFAAACDKALGCDGRFVRLWRLLDGQRRQPSAGDNAQAPSTPTASSLGRAYPGAQASGPGSIGLLGAPVPVDSDVVTVPVLTPEGGVTTMAIDRRHLLLGLGAAPVAAGLSRLTSDGAGHADLRRVGDAEVGEVLATVQALKLLDNRIGGGNLCATALMETRRVWRMVNTSRCTDDVAGRLRSAAGELAIFTGWLHYDASRSDDAWSLLTEGLTAARLGSDPNVEIHAYAQLSLVAGRSGRARDAVDLARAGQRIAGASAPQRLRSLLHVREAQGWSQLGEATESDRALGRARDAFDPRASADDPGWISFYTEAELEGLDAVCRDGLGQDTAAQRSYRTALDGLPTQYVRNREYFATGYALASARTGDLDQATDAGHRTLATVSEMSSARVRNRLRQLHRSLTDRAPEHAAVRAFDERYRAVLA
jgi:transcriptional regulator with XRE-family HTH domain